MNRSQDIVVIGGGMAGVAAALASSGRGARVTLVRRAPGATALSVGGWTGPMPLPLAEHFRAAGHEWLPAPPSGIASPDGAWKVYDLAAPAQAIAFAGPTLVCGIAGLPGFHAAGLTRLWMEFAGIELVPVKLVLDGTPHAGWSPVSLAAALERSSSGLANQLASLVQQHSARSVLAPAVLGLENHAAVRGAIETAIGVPVGEALGSAPSIPGWRLALALDRLLSAANITVLQGDLQNRSNGDRRLSAVNLITAGETRTLEADAFILATGKFIGGGISADGKLREGALGCPLWIEHAGEVFDYAEPLALTNADRHEEQPLLAAGVTVDAEGRPVTQLGEIVFDNVWAAGAVRRGGETARYGLGHAATEGWSAGERATA